MDNSGSFETDVHRWLTRATLDAIGKGTFSSRMLSTHLSLSDLAAFDYQYGAMDNEDNKLGKAYQNMM